MRCLFYLALTVAGLSAPSTTLPYLLEHPFFSAFIAYHANQQRLSYCKDLTAIRSSDTLFSRRRTAFLGDAGCNSTAVVRLFLRSISVSLLRSLFVGNSSFEDVSQFSATAFPGTLRLLLTSCIS